MTTPNYDYDDILNALERQAVEIEEVFSPRDSRQEDARLLREAMEIVQMRQCEERNEDARIDFPEDSE